MFGGRAAEAAEAVAVERDNDDSPDVEHDIQS